QHQDPSFFLQFNLMTDKNLEMFNILPLVKAIGKPHSGHFRYLGFKDARCQRFEAPVAETVVGSRGRKTTVHCSHSNKRLKQVIPPSALANSERSTVSTANPRSVSIWAVLT